ncbi:MAG: hypothetical protein JWN50_490 [Parcubacteria group bacterium]|nr:hypothetical protein [Parcubacteria group bacterium]
MRNLHADHYFQIGSAHYAHGLPCQDYALSGGNERSAVAVVSDGCSTGRHTDVGSRIQALSLLGAMKSVAENPREGLLDMSVAIQDRKKELLHDARMLLGLSSSDMLATCVYAYLSETGGFVHVEGDGVVAKKFTDGSLVASHYEWADNTPFYPAYTGLDLEEFVKTHGGDLSAMRLSRTDVFIDTLGKVGESRIVEFNLRDGLLGIFEEITNEEIETLESVAVFSDGAAQIEGVEWIDAVVELMSFKNFAGEFAKRRMIRALKNYERKSSKPVDDVSMAVIHIEHLHEEDEDHVGTDIAGQLEG